MKRVASAVVMSSLAVLFLMAPSQIGQKPLIIKTLSGRDFDCPTGGAPTSCLSAVTGRTYGVAYELPFDAASTECVYGQMGLPAGYEGGDVNVCPSWFSPNVSTGNVVWSLDVAQIKSGSAHDVEKSSRSFVLSISGVGTTQRSCVSYTGWPAGPSDAELKLCRVGGSTRDTMGGDAHLKRLTIETAY